MIEELEPFVEWFDREVETGVRYSDNATASLGPWSERREKFIRIIMQEAFFAGTKTHTTPKVKALIWYEKPEGQDIRIGRCGEVSYAVLFRMGRWGYSRQGQSGHVVGNVGGGMDFETEQDAMDGADRDHERRVHAFLEGYDD